LFASKFILFIEMDASSFVDCFRHINFKFLTNQERDLIHGAVSSPTSSSTASDEKEDQYKSESSAAVGPLAPEFATALHLDDDSATKLEEDDVVGDVNLERQATSPSSPTVHESGVLANYRSK
jgi:hypothetical protein